MLEFVDDLKLSVIADDKFMVLDDFTVKYYDNYVTVPKGFITDLASVPRVPVAYVITANKGTKSAVVHDYLYSKRELPRKLCDEIFLCGLETEGLGFFVRRSMYTAVRLFGSSHY